MNSRALAGLLAALAVLVALAVAVSMSEQRQRREPGLLLPDLKALLNDIGRIEVRTAGNKVAATLERREGLWVVVQRSGYPADLGKIRKNLIALAEAKIIEEKTSNPELYARLGVDDITKATAGGVQLAIIAGDKTTTVIVGNGGAGGERTYVRRAGEAASWLVSGAITTGRDASDWLDRTVVAIPATRVHAVSITQPDGKVLRAERAKPGSEEFSVSGIPAGRELSYSAAGANLAGAIAEISLDNVQPAAGFNPGDTKPVIARYEMEDGLVLEARTFKAGEGTHVAFSASADPELAARLAPPPVPVPKPAAAAGKPAKPGAPKAAEQPPTPKRPGIAEIRAEADQLNARLSKWVYLLPDFKIEQLTRRMEDILKPLPAPAAGAQKPGKAAKPATAAPAPPAS